MKDAKYYIKNLQMQPHPEGGYFKETYRSEEIISKDGLPARFAGDRNISTAIYYLLELGDFSAFHRIKSDECWHFYAGETLLIHMIDNAGNYSCIKLGHDLVDGERFQFVVPAGIWFASEPALNTPFALVGCTVAPGFNFTDFEMADRNELLKDNSQHETIIKRLTRQ
jgi:predicted cupin superfamily sugar epimerase